MKDDNFFSVRFWAINIQDQCSELAKSAEIRARKDEPMSEECYRLFLEKMATITHFVGILSYMIQSVYEKSHEQIRGQGSTTETVGVNEVEREEVSQ